MFYPIQLFHLQKADLAVCWFAAIMSEKSFKKRYKSITINKIDTIKICEEILQIMHSDKKNGNGMRFSLYLLSQLMHGVTKLQLYQTIYFEKEVLEIQQKLDFVLQEKEKKEDIDVIENLDICQFELSLVKEDNPQLDENLYLLPNQNLDHGIQMMMEDAICQNFGALTDEELDIMLEHDMMLSDINSEKKLQITHYSQERELLNDIEIAEEIHQERHLSQTTRSPVVVDISKTKTKSKELTLTPQKRVQNQPQVETPTKKRRLSFKNTEAMPIIENVTVEGIQAPISLEQVESLQSSNSKSFVIKKSKKIIDKKISLKGQLLRKRRQDVNYKCKQSSEPVQIHRFTSVKDLLKQPSHWEHKQWATNLHHLFKKHTTRPFKLNADENIELMQIEEALRAEETASKLNLPTELSTFGKDATITADASALGSIANIIPMMDLNDQNIAHEPLTMPLPETAPEIIISKADITKDTEHEQKKRDKETEIMDVSETDETLEDITILMERQHLNKNDHILESSIRSNETLQAISLTSHDILAMLEALWCDQECIKFNELISDTYSLKDITTAFHILLELHAKQKIVLTQKNCHDILWDSKI